MQDRKFRAGEQLWLRGHRATFVAYHRYAAHRSEAGVVRRHDQTKVRVVPLSKLADERAESLARAYATPHS